MFLYMIYPAETGFPVVTGEPSYHKKPLNTGTEYFHSCVCFSRKLPGAKINSIDGNKNFSPANLLKIPYKLYFKGILYNP